MRQKNKEWSKRLQSYYKKAIIIGIVLLVSAFLFGQNLKYLIIVPLLIGIASLSTFYHNFFRSPVNFELIKLATIASSAAYGVATGISVGLLSTIASKIISEKLDHTAIFSIIGIIVIAIAASIFASADIVVLGIALVIAYHAITAPFQLALGGNWTYGLIYVGSNIFFNIILFTRIAPFIMNLL